MSLYTDKIVPYLVHWSMRQQMLEPYRRRLVREAIGTVLEIGVGSGLNLPLYGTETTHVIGLDPSPKLLSMAHNVLERAVMSVELIEGSAEDIPLEDHSVDTVVTAWSLCSIPNVARALTEMRRVLKPASGRLLFVEHGRSPEANVSRWQDRLTPLWRRVAGGCHLNRAIRVLIESSGFRIERIDAEYMRGPKLLTFMYEGQARPA